MADFHRLFEILLVWTTVLATNYALKFDASYWQNSPSTNEQQQDHTWDFNFDDKDETYGEVVNNGNENKSSGKSSFWTEDDLCKNLQCKPHQMCLVEDDDVAVCVSKRKFKNKSINKSSPTPETKPTGQENSEEIIWETRTEENEKPQSDNRGPCIPCPVVKPDFICGSDNHTYSSVCRLEFRNCMHGAGLSVSCKGFCPCKTIKTEYDHNKESQMKERWNRYMNKYQNTINKASMVHKSLKKSNTSIKKSDKAPFLNTFWTTSAPNKIVSDPVKNSVLHSEKSAAPINDKSCTESELKAMGDRLLDWFTVVMVDHHRGQSRRRSFRLSHTDLPDCKPEVSWMFQHLDTDGDLKLSLRELYDLENDDRERCLRPYLLDCDIERDLVLSPYEWCSCFDKSQRPCASALRRVSGDLGGYVPHCSGDGYYLPTQCHTSSGTCWCVDKHGVEFTNTRRKGRPDCEGLLRKGQYHDATRDDEDMEEGNESEEHEGSADRPLDF